MNPAGIDPKWVFYLGIVVSIEQAIGQGSIKLTNMIPTEWIPGVTDWSAALAFCGTVIMTALSGYSSKASGPLVKPIVLVAVMLGGLFAFTGDARAQQSLRLKPLTGDVAKDFNIGGGTGPISSKLTGSPLNDLLGALDAKLLPDLQYALKLANASGSKVTAPCYQAWIDIINTRQKAVQADDGTAMTMPDPHLVTDFEKLVELRNALQPESDFMVKCSPVASMVKKDILGFIGVVVGGGAGLATLVPGL